MNKKTIIPLIVLILGASAALEYFLPSTLAVPIIAALVFVLGLVFSAHFQKPLKTSAFLLLGAILVFGFCWMLNQRIFDKTAFHSYSALIACSFFVGLSFPKKENEQEFSFLAIFLMAWVAGFAQSNFNFLGTLPWSIVGYLVVYGSSGYILQRARVNLVNHFLFILPVLVVALVEGLAINPTNWIYGYVFLPFFAILAYVFGCLAAMPKLTFKAP